MTIAHRRRFAAFTGIVVAIAVLFGGASVWAQSSGSGAISRSFQTSEQADMVPGTLVSTLKDNSNSVELADTSSASRLAGVVSNEALVELSDGKQSEVQVTMNGSSTVLVSDINGRIRAGDKVTASPLKGIGMLATEDAQIIGTAQSDFNEPSSKTRTVKDKQGKEHTVRVGYVSVQAGISYYVAPTSQLVPPFLQSIANNIAGRPVSFMRILLSCVALLLAFGSISILIYTSVRSGIISLGRNPLAASAIQRGLIGVVVIVLLTAVLALASVYLILST